MISVWREYGVIGTLLVVAVGGYLYVSHNEPDLLAASLDSIGGHLLSMIPDGGERSGVQAALDTLEVRVKSGEVRPEQIERYAASVFNLGTSGEKLAPEDAEMVVRLAYSDAGILPTPEGHIPPPPKSARIDVRVQDLEDLASELEPMVAFFETLKEDPGPTGPSLRFYSDGKLHVVVDDRLREKLESDVAARPLIRDKALSWRARFTDAVRAERQRHVERSEELGRMAGTRSDTLKLGPAAEALARMSRLRSLGLVSEPEVDSMLTAIEVEIKAIIRDLPPPPPPPPDPETTGASVSSSSG